MTKLSKILLCICFSIICICGFTFNTYCGVEDAPSEFYEIRLSNTINEDGIKNNLISPDIYSNFSFQNFNFSFTSTQEYPIFYDLFFGDSYPSWVDDTINNFDSKFVQSFYPFAGVDNYYYKVTFFIEKWGGTGDCWININNINFELIKNDYVYHFDNYNPPYPCVNTVFVPYILNSNYGILKYYSYFKGTMSFDVVSDNNYFTNFFELTFRPSNNISSNSLTFEFTNSNNLKFSKTFDNNSITTFKNGLYGSVSLLNNYDSSRSFVKTISITEDFSGIEYTTFYDSSKYLLSNFVSDTNYGNYVIYFMQYNKVLDNSINNSPLVPIGSNSFYKVCEWWDIPSHLYNFFIYLIFDAPIISSFTKLGMIIINFLVESFNFVISLFNGVSNVFFITIFIGMFVLIFLLKIIFGGKS